MPFLTKKLVTCRNINGDSFTHAPGTVLSEWEVSDFIREKIKEGSEHYRTLFEPLTDKEAHAHRVRSTEAEGPHLVEGKQVPPPWDDYVGLHPTEIAERMRSSSVEKVAHVRRYERGGMNRGMVIDFVHPAEHEPWTGYDAADVRDVLEKFSIISDAQVQDAVLYEREHKARPAIVEWDRALETSAVGATA